MLEPSRNPEELVSRADYDAVVEQLLKVQQDYSNLQIQFLWLQKQVFGRKSEKLDPNQLGLFESELASEIEPVGSEIEIEVSPHSRKTNSGRKPLPDSLPRLRVEHFPEQRECSTCNDGEKKGKLHTGYYWAVHAPPNLVYYRYASTRAGEIPREIFANYKGVVQTDLYAGYNEVYLPEQCERLGCFAHVRRKFLEKGGASNKDGNDIIKQIAKLYRVESDAKTYSSQERYELRQNKSVDLLKSLFEKIDSLNARLLPKNPLKEATEYALKQKTELLRYLEDGRYQIDNNAIERQMRPIAIGRKNYLFAGSHAGAEAAAIFYSLINSCKLNGVNPREYFVDLIRRLPTHPTAEIRELLPHRWAPLPKA